jgi:hypothetical protein
MYSPMVKERLGTMKRKKKERRGIQSVEIGTRVIEALRASATPLHLKDLAKAAGMPTSSVIGTLLVLYGRDFWCRM